MDFINKLIKKGIFCLVVCFSFMVFLFAQKAEAIETDKGCTISILNDGEFLLLNESAGWSDTGAKVVCGEGDNEVEHKNIMVSVNGSLVASTNDYGQYVSDGYLKKNNSFVAGYYVIEYSWRYTGNDGTDDDINLSITRHVRILPSNLNSVRNIWMGEFRENTNGEDYFVKIVDRGNKYLTIGNFGNSGYVVSFDSTGKYEWHQVYTNEVLSDIVNNGNYYFVVGKNNQGAFIKSFMLNDTVGINAGTVKNFTLSELSVANRILVSTNVYVAGYKENANGTTSGAVTKLTWDAGVGFTIDGTHLNALDSKYNSIIGVESGSVVAVGSTSVSGNAGATGGLITVCDAQFSCESKDPYLWRNSTSNTTTIFNDVVKENDKYIVVGNSRLTNLYSSENTTNSVNAILVLLNENFEIVDGSLVGRNGQDDLYSVKKVSNNKYIVVGEYSGVGVYLTVSIEENKLTISENGISGANGNLAIKDVFVRVGKSNTAEVNLIFVGNTNASRIEGIAVPSVGGNDAFLVIVDNTVFAKYEDNNIRQNYAICGGTSCKVSELSDDYKMMYGNQYIDVFGYDASGNELIVSTANISTYSVFHTFTNEQGVKFIIAKKINITKNPVAPDITINNQGIDKWYMYSRYQNISSGGDAERLSLWEEDKRYMPIENGLEKIEGEKYYKIQYNSAEQIYEFVEDTSEGVTDGNYIALAAEPLSLNVAFQSEEKLEEFALIQEFARVAFVNDKTYNYEESGITYFPGENTSFTGQNYYFVYYIDLNVSNSDRCETVNGILVGRCTSYTGYAFASLKRIKEVAQAVIKQNNYFKSEVNNRYTENNTVKLPVTNEFKEEVSTINYMKEATINMKTDLFLEVSYYSIDSSDNTKFVTSPEITSKTGVDKVIFSASGDYKNEGKYVVRYCYNYVPGVENVENCGKEATFVIDRTKPLISYGLLNQTKGVIKDNRTSDNPYLISYNMTIESIFDIDPYAYTIVNNKKYYLRCNENIGSNKCLKNVEDYIYKSYSHDKSNPNKIYNIKVYDRAGNILDTYFKIGTGKPEFYITQSSETKFTFILDFFEKNDIDSFDIYFTSSVPCSTNVCTQTDNESKAKNLSQAIIVYVKALIANNNALIESAKTNPAINLEVQLVKSVTLEFEQTGYDSQGNVKAGVNVPIPEKLDGGDGLYTFEKNANFVISQGLYKFVLSDVFTNSVVEYVGLSLGKAELDVYINADENAVEFDGEGNVIYETRIPGTKGELGDDYDTTTRFLVKNLSKYEYEIPNNLGGLESDFNRNMYYTNKFVYIKLKINAFGIVRISKAKEPNSMGGYGISDETNTNLQCLFKIYGSSVEGSVKACDGGEKILVNNINTYSLLGDGIYLSALAGDYYYLVFTEEGVYDVWSEVGTGATTPATPVAYAFTIDRTTPNIGLNVTGTGKGELSESEFNHPDFKGFEYIDSNTYKYNIGNLDLQLNMALDKLTGNTTTNRLLAIHIDGPAQESNHIDDLIARGDSTILCNPYKKDENNNPVYCNAYAFAQLTDYITFNYSGTYVITIADASKNMVSYTFIIDKDAPSFIDIVDASGKSFDLYQQYVDVKIIVNEYSFLTKKDSGTEAMLTLTYSVGATTETIIVTNNNGACKVTGVYIEGECDITSNNGTYGLILEVIITINKEDRLTGNQMLTLSATDYFGNINDNEKRSLYFDNDKPYMFYSDEYTPTLEFGENVSTEIRNNNMLSMDQRSGVSSFGCNLTDGVKFVVGIDGTEEKTIIYCGDKPYRDGNTVSVYAYEAYRIAFNNYIYNPVTGNFDKVINGTYLKVTDTVYRKKYIAFTSKSSLQYTDEVVYQKGEYIEVALNEKVNPNEIYYLDNQGNESVSIRDIYINDYSSCSLTNAACVLYNMYVNQGDFSKINDASTNPSEFKFYQKDENGYRVATTIDYEKPGEYYHVDYDIPYIKDGGKYLPALTLENTCVKTSSMNCTMVGKGRIKVQNANVEYRNILEGITPANYDTLSNIEKDNIAITRMFTGENVYTVIDNRVWQIALDEHGNEVSFGFDYANNLGRPIIFVGKDEAGNISSNYLETVIAIKDTDAPRIEEVHIMYELDNSADATLNNYIKETKYYRIYENPSQQACLQSKSKYYFYENGEYKEIECSALKANTQYYASEVVYTPVADGMSKQTGVEYYKRKSNDVLSNNYLTSENMVVKFSEPIYKVKCSYYMYDASDVNNPREYTYNCNFDNLEFDYYDNKQTFYLDFKYDGGAANPNYFVVYTITVFDFSNRSSTFSAFYIDREKPTLQFNSNVNAVEELDVVYSGGNTTSDYNYSYITTNFLNQIRPNDNVNTKIQGNTDEINKYSYEVKYYAFNYDKAYRNYIYNSSSRKFEKLADGESKAGRQTYTLVKKPSNYVLKGNEGVCVEIESEEYCYVSDELNYYPSLLTNSNYWKALDLGEAIPNNLVGVYKIEYKVTDHSGNISDTLIKTVYFVDDTPPVLNFKTSSGDSYQEIPSTSKYGYYSELYLKVSNEKEAGVYVYSCKDAVTDCELPNEIFAVPGTSLNYSFKEITSNTYETKFDKESIYKLYMYDRGRYVASYTGYDKDSNMNTEEVMTLKYNYVEYTFLIDTTSPSLYLEADKDEKGNLYYYAHLDSEEFLYCIGADRFAGELSFTSYVECKNSVVFAGEWKETSDYINMFTVYEYSDNSTTYKVNSANGEYILKINNTPYKLSYKGNDEYEYYDAGKDERYTLIIESGVYKLKVNNEEEYTLTVTHTYRDTDLNNDYKFVIDGETYKLFINDSENIMTLNNGIYEYKNESELISYFVRFVSGSYQLKIANEKRIVRQLYNSNGEMIYQEIYSKLEPYEQKYFYITYYYKSGDSLVPYEIGQSYDENNVYIIKSIDLYFRNDGKYLIMAKDKSGNDAGRKKDGLNFDPDYSEFIIDNTSPSYNASNNAPTGINYWYSVPSSVVNIANVENIRGITKTDQLSSAYNLNSGLNSSFFYAFATEREAKKYLETIYKNHIESLKDNTCTDRNSGKAGFEYTYYNYSVGDFETKCFVGEGGETNKKKALDEILGTVYKLIFETFSGYVLFGDSTVHQIACNTADCVEGTNMYKNVYLRVDTKTNTKTIVESCVKGSNVECIKVSVKIIKGGTENKSSSFEIKSNNAKDTSKMVVYNRAVISGSSTSKSEYNSSATISLSNNYYYIFEEFDTTITYTNYPQQDASYTVTHQNVNYYGIYVDYDNNISVYYDDGDGINYTDLINSGSGFVRSNVDNYYLIIKNNNDSQFENRYEIFALRDEKGNILEVYTYLRLEIDGIYYNLNDARYKVVNGNEYYFKIPIPNESLTRVAFIERTGTRTSIDVSLSQVAPSIDVVYGGEGGRQTVQLIITDSALTATSKDTVTVYYKNGMPGSTYAVTNETVDIRASLLCNPNTSGLVYDCINTGAVNGRNVYRVLISNLQDLYGFFKVELEDNHGNTNVIEFMYNPADMSSSYPNIVKFVSRDDENLRMMTNDKIELEFDNQINYVILYKYNGSELVPVCNTKNISEGLCDQEGNSQNKVTIITDDQGNYNKTVIYYVDEGMYTAEIINRASEVIYNACFTQEDEFGNIVVSDDCKAIKTYRSVSCSWNSNPDYCDDAFEVITKTVIKVNNNISYSKLEIDKTIPQIDPTMFTVSTPAGDDEFRNNGVYTNAEVTIKWSESLTQLSYTCEYIDSNRMCPANSTGFYVANKQYSFIITDNVSTKFTFWFEDYAGNTTESNKYSFTINIVPPEFEVYEMDDNGQIINGAKIEKNSTIKNNAQLLCRLDGVATSCDVYDVVLERLTNNGYTVVGQKDLTKIYMEYGEQATYRYIIKIKNAVTGKVYDNIRVEFQFKIDRDPPEIYVEGTQHAETGIYSTDVKVSLASDGLGVVYYGCVDEGQYMNGIWEPQYNCKDAVEIGTFGTLASKDSYTLQETGIYMIIASDSIGNITQGEDIKYISIDKENPTISIKVIGEYLEYLVPENGFTNSEKVSIEAMDNNRDSYFKYRMKQTNDQYGEWIYVYNVDHTGAYLECVVDGFYEVVPIDAVGNEGLSRHFIIYRQAPMYKVTSQGKDITKESSVIKGSFKVEWTNSSLASYIAPIVKVTMNGNPYTSGTEIKQTGEYLFVFTDLAGNTVSDKRTVNVNDSVCLNNVKITPKKQYTFPMKDVVVIQNDEYVFEEDDVIIFAVNVYYFGGSSCGKDLLSYQFIDKSSYMLVTKNIADFFNSRGEISVNFGEQYDIEKIGEYAEMFVVSKSVAKKELNLPIGENFFTKDPLGWSLIFAAGAAVLYVGIRLIFFRKKVRVL